MIYFITDFTRKNKIYKIIKILKRLLNFNWNEEIIIFNYKF